MKAHKNARTTQYSRQILVERVAQGLPAWQVAQELGVSRQTVQKWLARARAEGPSGLEDAPLDLHTAPHGYRDPSSSASTAFA